MKKKRMTIVLLLLGKYERQVRQVDKKIAELLKLKENAELIVAMDDVRWSNAPQMQMLGTMYSEIQMICPKNRRLLPAQLVNLAIQQIKTPYVMFSLLEDPLLWRYEQFAKALADERAEDASAVYLIASKVDDLQEIPPTALNFYGWCQSSRRGAGLGDFCLSTAFLEKLGALDENPLLQTEIERWFSLAVARKSKITVLEGDGLIHKRLAEYPLTIDQPVPRDLAIRYATYCQGIAAKERSNEVCAQEFARDLRGEELALYVKLTGISVPDQQIPYNSRYRILIIGGHWEYHHNQVCFFNFLEKLYGQGFGTYRAAFEYEMPANLAVNYDLVIFARCRNETSLAMMRLCEDRKIPTIYMIDDNWMSIAKDFPEQGGMFVAGNPNYDNFLEALSLCKATWLFSDLIKKDIIAYTRCVKKFKIAVDLEAFDVKEPRVQRDDNLYIGFSGSMRFDDTAFQALARFARRHKEVTIVLVGILSPEQEKLFQNIKTIRLGFESYARYAKNISKVRPDVLIAPLTGSHTGHSKCYNKYIESGAAGAVCIYSHCMPYTQVVKDGINGYFVEDESAESWYQKLSEVVSDIKKLRQVQANMRKDLKKNHTVDVLLPEFTKKLMEIVEEEVLQDD